MDDNRQKIKKIERSINLIKLMIEKRSDRIKYYEKLIEMGLTFDDQRKLEFFAAHKRLEIKNLYKKLDELYLEKAFYEA